MSLDSVLRTKSAYKLYLKDDEDKLYLIDSIFPVGEDWVVFLRKTAQQVKVFEKLDNKGE
jgi:hypothetical protein